MSHQYIFIIKIRYFKFYCAFPKKLEYFIAHVEMKGGGVKKGERGCKRGDL